MDSTVASVTSINKEDHLVPLELASALLSTMLNLEVPDGEP